MRRLLGLVSATIFQDLSRFWCLITALSIPKIKVGRNSIVLWSRVRNQAGGNSLQIGANCTIRHLQVSFTGQGNQITIGDGVRIYEGTRIEMDGNDCELIIHAKTTIGQASFFLGESNTSISLGEDCMLSRQITFTTSDYHSILDQESGERINLPDNIEIAPNVWIGNNVLINKGASVPTETVIAARAVVSGNKFKSNSIIAGIPARTVREGIKWSREKIERYTEDA
ncbi:MAG: hypothetical protein AAFO03_23895 [Bacteroidota bacterium]